MFNLFKSNFTYVAFTSKILVFVDFISVISVCALISLPHRYHVFCQLLWWREVGRSTSEFLRFKGIKADS